VSGSAATRREKALPRPQALLKEMLALPEGATRQSFVARNPALHRAELVTELAGQVIEQIRVEVAKAERLAEAALAIAQHIHDKESLARALRAKANVSYAQGNHALAISLHEQAIALFEAAHNSHEVARTRSSSLQPMLLLGEYERAFATAEQARKVFVREKDTHRLARLEINIGNIYFRQDRFAEALVSYDRARKGLSAKQDREAIAAVLSNMATCHISLNNFSQALRAYREARRFCDEHGMPLLTAQADYNIAYLYYLRGDYNRAIELFQAAQRKAQGVGDGYHGSLCDLDLAELYLELNLSSHAGELAQQGYEGFRKLGMGYESAKCLAFSAIAAGQMGRFSEALQLFSQAREAFVQDGNSAWPSIIDLYRALVLYEEDALPEAQRLCLQSLRTLRALNLNSKAVLAELLLGRIALREGDTKQSIQRAQTALEELRELETPNLKLQAHLLMGDVRAAADDRNQAYASYQAARQAFETLRSSLRRDELKIAFVKNRLEVYEKLVELCLKKRNQAALAEAFGYIEQAKSRSLMELFAQPMVPAPEAGAGQSELARSIRDLRKELNWYYSRMEREQLQPHARTPEKIAALQKEVRIREKKLAGMLHESALTEAGFRAPETSVDAVRAALPQDSLIVEYFQIRGEIFACLLDHKTLEILPLTEETKVAATLHWLQFQLAKFRLDSAYVKAFQDILIRTTNAHLNELYQQLIAPISKRLTAGHLIFVPHGILHYVPFHALFDGGHHLIERHTVSYSPSAGIYGLCQRRSANSTGPALLMGVPDRRAPAIREEVEALKDILPRAELFLGKQASPGLLRRRGPASRMIHIATHGHFRQDNPMFSSIRLGGSFLNLYDLYQLKLPVELITLSGCSTGLNVVAAGDELIGLVRGLLHAGAQSLMLSMWDVHDESTAGFMKSFYRLLRRGWSKSASMQKAMLDLRSSYPHPYQWAPFFLVGKG
jgi:CHAT domain-containing protein